MNKKISQKSTPEALIGCVGEFRPDGLFWILTNAQAYILNDSYKGRLMYTVIRFDKIYFYISANGVSLARVQKKNCKII